MKVVRMHWVFWRHLLAQELWSHFYKPFKNNHSFLQCFVFIILDWKLLLKIYDSPTRVKESKRQQKARPSAINTHFKLHCTDFLSGCPRSSPGRYCSPLLCTVCSVSEVPLLFRRDISCLTICFYKSEAFRQYSRILWRKRIVGVLCKSHWTCVLANLK